MKSGLIGNCQYAALSSASGAIDWLCWPRFDSSFVFGGLLDSTVGGEFRICSAPISDGVQGYIDNTNVLVTTFRAPDGEFEIVDFAPRFRQFERSFRPTMLMRIVRPLRGTPRIVATCKPVYDYGRQVLVSTLASNHIEYVGAPQPMRLTTDASLSYVSDGVPFTLHRPTYFVLTWGAPLEAPLAETCEQFLDQTIAYWRRWVKHCHLPEYFQEQAIRSALVLKMHQFEDTGAIIASTTTSLPEAPGSQRNWDYRYCWIRDACFTVGALCRLSHFEELEGLAGYLRNLLASNTSELQPVYGIGGERILTETIEYHLAGYHGHTPVRIGNQAFEQRQFDVYGEMILALAPLYTDIRFRSQLPDLGGIAYLVDGIETTLGLPDAGLWEFRGTQQVHTFTQLMHWAGARQARNIATRLGAGVLGARAERLEREAAEILRNRCRNPISGLYQQAQGVNEMDASMLLLINMGFLHPSDPLALRLCDQVSHELQVGKKLIRRYSHKDDFGQPQVAFVVCSFWLAEAYARVGRRETARELIELVMSYGGELGLLSEDIDPISGEMWGNYPQTYSHVGLLNAAFSLREE